MTTIAFRRVAERTLCTAVAALLLAAGCSKTERLKVYPVTGTVTYNNKPVEGATVVFHGAGPDSKPATGITDAEGKFKLTTYDTHDGAAAGKHAVSVTKYAAAAASNESLSMEEAAAKTAVPPEAAKSEIPEKYSDPRTSKIELTVSDSDPNDFKIELKD